MIKKLFFSVFLTAVSAGAMAGWTQVGESESAIFYIDLATVSKSGNKVKTWTLTDFKAEQKRNNGPTFFSTKKLSEFNCKNKTSHLLSMTIFSGHMAEGEKIHTDNEPEIRWNPVSFDNLGNPFFWKAVCDQH